MLTIPFSIRIKCSFGSNFKSLKVPHYSEPDVYYAETQWFSTIFSELKNYISTEEREKADKFRFDADRNTYISSHAVLRLILAKKLKTIPLSLSLINGKYNKPNIPGNPVYFNIAHTRNAFAIAVSEYYEIGIDMEEINRRMDFISIIKINFSRKECDFILKNDEGTDERFFLLWTRKEALLKALGTGITDHLEQIEVSGQENFIDKDLFDNTVTGMEIPDHYIYSGKVRNNYLSFAIPSKAFVECQFLERETIATYFC